MLSGGYLVLFKVPRLQSTVSKKSLYASKASQDHQLRQLYPELPAHGKLINCAYLLAAVVN